MRSDTILKNYTLALTDTSIGGTKGLIARFIRNDGKPNTYNLIYYYVTIVIVNFTGFMLTVQR